MNRFGLLVTAVSLAAYAYGFPVPSAGSDDLNPSIPPAVEREFRAAWVATVANIDWPSRRDLSVEQQKAELRRMFDRFVELNLNAVIFQVRPASDAIYASELEPWSEYLSGHMGRAPQPFYDPLEFAIEEAHARGMELHAWFNPFRARHATGRGAVSADHVSKRHPKIVRQYGRQLWLDPGMEEARRYSLDVIMDVVRRYDIDGVHIDDYFYPYRESGPDGREIDFPDAASYAAARAAGETRSRNDWRRHNVDRFVESMYREVKAEKSHVQVGISPFGIWRPGHPPQIQGFDAYEQIYADAKLWLNEGWVDYFTPQLYWPIDRVAQSYPVLLQWWVSENTHQRHMWPGNFTSRVQSGESGQNNWPVSEIVRQIEVTRDQQGAEGNVHFSARALIEQRGGLGETLRTGVYAQQALVPATPWLEAEPPSVPRARMDGRTLRLEVASGDPPWQWVVQLFDGDQWSTSILPGRTDQLTLGGEVRTAWVRTVNRLGELSDPAVVGIAR